MTLLHFLEQLIEKLEKENKELVHKNQELDHSNRVLTDFKNALDESSLVSIVDRNKKITYVNDKFCAISRYSKDELLGQNHDILRSGMHPPEFYDKLWQIVNSGQIWTGDVCNTTKDGKLFWNKTTIIPFKNEVGEIYQFLAIRIDITGEKDLASKLARGEKLASIGQSSSSIVHDMRNSLSVIQNEIKIMEKQTAQTSDVKNSEEFARINKAITMMTNQTESILNFIDKKPVIREKSNLAVLIKDSSACIAMPNSIKVYHDLQDVFCDCDPIKMESVFSNLILNAVQAMTGGGQLVISLYSKEDLIKIEVVDTGNGIPEDKIETVFEPFYTTKQKGTGLGLANCKEIIESHQGKISAKNNSTKGATFTIELPKNLEK